MQNYGGTLGWPQQALCCPLLAATVSFNEWNIIFNPDFLFPPLAVHISASAFSILQLQEKQLFRPLSPQESEPWEFQPVLWYLSCQLRSAYRVSCTLSLAQTQVSFGSQHQLLCFCLLHRDLVTHSYNSQASQHFSSLHLNTVYYCWLQLNHDAGIEKCSKMINGARSNVRLSIRQVRAQPPPP